MCTGLFCTIENGNGLDRGRKCCKESVDGEWTVETDFKETDFLAFRIQVINSLFNCLINRAHRNNDTVSSRSTVIVEKLIVRTTDLIDLTHVILNNLRKSQIERVGCFTGLEIYIRVLGSTSKCRVIRGKGSPAETG